MKYKEFFKEKYLYWIIIFFVLLAALGRYKNVFNLGKASNMVSTKTSIDPSKIQEGGPGKDGIPSIDRPKFVSVQDSDFKDSDLVMIVVIDGQTKAYPILIMNWHEIVNDRIGQTPVAITYCPLCGSGIAFKRILNGQEVQFGVSGKLYNSDLLMYDRKTDSLWSQITGEAVSGELAGEKLEMLVSNLIDFKTLKEKYPDALVLSKDTGFNRDYSRSPYGDYDTSSQIYFPVDNASDKLFAKDRIIGIELNGRFKAYRFETLKAKGNVKDQFNNQILNLSIDDKGQVSVVDSSGKKISFVNTFWFAWVAFHPDTEMFK